MGRTTKSVDLTFIVILLVAWLAPHLVNRCTFSTPFLEFSTHTHRLDKPLQHCRRHYVTAQSVKSDRTICDGRPHLGVSNQFNKKSCQTLNSIRTNRTWKSFWNLVLLLQNLCLPSPYCMCHPCVASLQLSCTWVTVATNMLILLYQHWRCREIDGNATWTRLQNVEVNILQKCPSNISSLCLKQLNLVSIPITWLTFYTVVLVIW